MNDIEEFVRRELELKEKLAFREWMLHIKESHSRLLEMLRRHDLPESEISVEVMSSEADGLRALSVFTLPAGCRRVIVDADGVYGSVWGFAPADGGEDVHVNGRLRRREPVAILSSVT